MGRVIERMPWETSRAFCNSIADPSVGRRVASIYKGVVSRQGLEPTAPRPTNTATNEENPEYDAAIATRLRSG